MKQVLKIREPFLSYRANGDALDTNTDSDFNFNFDFAIANVSIPLQRVSGTLNELFAGDFLGSRKELNVPGLRGIFVRIQGVVSDP